MFTVESGWGRWSVALGCALLLFPGLGRLPLLDPDEGRYARTAQEMIERGDFVVPHLDGEPRLQKPVLFYWLEIAAFEALGFTESAARLPSALAGAGTLLWLYAFARPRAGERTALLACAILATTPLFLALSRAATTDMTLAFLVFGATASLHAGIVEPVRRPLHLWAGGICLGLGLLTKGPVALLVPLLVVGTGAAARRRAPITVAGRAVFVSWIFVAVALPWAALLIHRVGWESALEIWRREALERITTGVDHPEAAGYLLLTAPVTFFPWSAFVPLALLAALKDWRKGAGFEPLLVAWAVGPFLFWTLSRGKLDSYLLPSAPAVALLVASALGERAAGQRALRWGAWLLAAFGSLALLPFPVTRMVQSAPAALPLFALLAGSAALAAALLAFLRAGPVASLGLAGAWGALLVAALHLVPVPWAEERSTRALVREAGIEDPAGPLYLHRLLAPSLGFYTGRVPVPVPARGALIRRIDAGGAAGVVLEERRERAVRELLERGFRVASRSGGRLLLRRGGGEPPPPTRESPEAREPR